MSGLRHRSRSKLGRPRRVLLSPELSHGRWLTVLMHQQKMMSCGKGDLTYKDSTLDRQFLKLLADTNPLKPSSTHVYTANTIQLVILFKSAQ